MGIISEEAKQCLTAWKKNSASQIDWGTAENVASVAGTFLKAFLGL
jgi:hypothetical protein